MDKDVERFFLKPNLISVQESPAYDSSSIRAIKKDFVKEQRKQFENESESSADNVQAAVPLCKNEEIAKRKSPFVLKTWQSLHDGYNGSKIKLSPNNGKPLSPLSPNNSKPLSPLSPNNSKPLSPLLPNNSKPLSPLSQSSGGRKSLSTHMEMRLSAFENSGMNNAVGCESPVKPAFRPKPEHLGIKTLVKSPIISPVLSSNSSGFSALSTPSRLHCLKGKNDSAVQNVSQELGPKSFIPQSCSKEATVLRHFRSPETEKQLSNKEAKGFSNVGINQGIRNDQISGRSPTVIGRNPDVVIPVNSGHGFVKSILTPPPPPTPPRISAEINPTAVPTSPETDGLIRGAVYNFKTPESKVKLEADCSKLTPSTGHKVSAAKKSAVPKSPAKFSADRSKIDEWWESKFIRTSQPRTPRTKETHHIRRINNPCYMYAKISQPDDVIVGQPLVRHHSDEVLDSTPAFKMRGNKCAIHYDDGPVYHSPMELAVQKQKRLETVMFDKSGYAVPSSIRDPHTKIGIGEFARAEVNSASKTSQSNHHESSYVKSKVSNAYAVLRLPMFPGSHRHTERTEEGDYDIDIEEHKRLLRHVSNVKYKTDEAIAKYEKVRLASTDRLFQYAMIIGLYDDGCGGNTPKITFCFPKDMTISEKQTSFFCFPDADDLKPSADYNGEMFSFVLTNATGDRRYGLCKRYLPPGSGTRLPEALCVVSIIGDSAFYGRLLDAVKESRFTAMKYAEETLQMAYAKPFPQPNHEVYLRTAGPNNKGKTLILKRALDLRLHTADFSLLLRLLDISTLIKVFSAILLERKIIFIAKQLSTLSLCICAIVSLLYPFEWQHTFVTILPSNLTDVIQAPTPYILGLLSSSVSKFSDIINELDEVLVVDLDEHSLRKSEGDEGRIIPKKLQKALTVALSDDQVDGQNTSVGLKGEGVQDATVAEAFLRLFVETCGHYTEYLCRQPDGEVVFQRELFVKAVHSRSIRLFLEWFTQTQMFSIFVTGRLKGDIKRGYFEERILEYRQEMEETTSTLENMKAIGKKIADFFQKSGDKLRKTFQKTVYV